MLLIRLLFKNAFLRHKLRSVLTVLGVTIAILAFGLLRTVITTWYLGVETSSPTRLVTRNNVSIIFPLPLSYREKIRQVEGVKIVSYGSWFGGVYKDKKNFFANFAVEPRTYLELYPEFIVPPDDKEAFLRDRRGFIAGKKLADRFGWKKGDIVTLEGTIYPGKWDFILRGIYRGRDLNIDETQFFFHWDYLNESVLKSKISLSDQVGFYMIGISSPGISAQVSQEIDAMFKNSAAETITETEKAFVQGFIAMSEAIIVAIQLVSLVVILIIMAVVANTMAMTTRERTGEYSILKTLGFGGGVIALLIMGESLLVTLSGCILGIALTYPIAGAFGTYLGTYFPVFNVENETVLLDFIAAVLVAFAAAVIPVRNALKLRVAEGLRRIG